MAAGQLAGGLAWLTISGEDAPDLVGSAPVAPSRLLRAKVEAVHAMHRHRLLSVRGGAGFVVAVPGAVAAVGIFAAAVSSTAIQLWFRSQAKRSEFRRRHTSSRIATFAEALISITWAATGGIAVKENRIGSPLRGWRFCFSAACGGSVRRARSRPAGPWTNPPAMLRSRAKRAAWNQSAQTQGGTK